MTTKKTGAPRKLKESTILADLARVMTRYQIQEYHSPSGAVIKLSSIAMVSREAMPDLKLVDGKESSEDDLYFSATNYKERK